ncbi:ParB/RepB/Spo0J family partition protein [Legionella hackeliae]|uniref:Probable chromosome-partitioning protein ParB n=1 Tax=Legionella hackeliae TaxID=449 RepID=A0A0A8USM7_LEGHA|nr:ParB/RepB/Spo0J family partition protein [Legionella hackeliae]KTD12462.1 partition protein ParB [Legionella hackeliae]CEK11875.1 putative chromosome-partitioning protein parB [Legionella hackeliae]STX48641.1 chromosome partitioning protein ParB [Legionella hackeliae]
MKRLFKLIPIEFLKPGRYQPRKHFEQTALQELADSIASQGLIEPLVVRELAGDSFEIIAGERRWRAAMLAELAELPCLIGEYTDEQAAAVTLIENIQRENLNLIEEAEGYRRLLDEFHFQQEEIATLVGKSRSHVTNILRLLTLCDAIQDEVKSGQLSMGHAKMLVGLTGEQQRFLAQQIVENEWSVRYLEKKVKEMKEGASLPNPQRDKDIKRLEAKIAEQIGAPVQIVTNEGDGGWLQLKFFNNDTLAGLLERMGLRYD